MAGKKIKGLVIHLATKDIGLVGNTNIEVCDILNGIPGIILDDWRLNYDGKNNSARLDYDLKISGGSISPDKLRAKLVRYGRVEITYC